jgi:hypothetical protein
MWFSTMIISKLNRGNTNNSSPSYTEAVIDIRFTDKWKDYKEIIDKLTKTATELNEIRINVIYTGI